MSHPLLLTTLFVYISALLYWLECLYKLKMTIRTSISTSLVFSFFLPPLRSYLQLISQHLAAHRLSLYKLWDSHDG
jgi:hypothetical protein